MESNSYLQYSGYYIKTSLSVSPRSFVLGLALTTPREIAERLFTCRGWCNGPRGGAVVERAVGACVSGGGRAVVGGVFVPVDHSVGFPVRGDAIGAVVPTDAIVGTVDGTVVPDMVGIKVVEVCVGTLVGDSLSSPNPIGAPEGTKDGDGVSSVVLGVLVGDGDSNSSSFWSLPVSSSLSLLRCCIDSGMASSVVGNSVGKSVLVSLPLSLEGGNDEV